jgi:hypothetical protein
MAATDILLQGDAQQSCISFSDVIWNLDDRWSEPYLGPAARELSRRNTPGFAWLDYRSPDTASIRVTCCAVVATVRH